MIIQVQIFSKPDSKGHSEILFKEYYNGPSADKVAQNAMKIIRDSIDLSYGFALFDQEGVELGKWVRTDGGFRRLTDAKRAPFDMKQLMKLVRAKISELTRGTRIR